MKHEEFARLPDLANRRLGGSVVAASDELFAERENLIKPEAPEYSAYTFGPKGQIYDGWETRRRRDSGHDHAIVRLGMPGVVHGIIVDTANFTGNFPPEISVEGCAVEGYPAPNELDAADWVTLAPRSPVHGDARNPFEAGVRSLCTHVRLSIYPDGGVARLRVHGEPVPDPRLFPVGSVDLAALENGGAVTGCSNMFYASPVNLISLGEARVMGEGWETARRRGEGNDWVELALAGKGVLHIVELDARCFVGNAPGWAALNGRTDGADAWVELLPRTRLQPDTRHRFRLDTADEVTHVRLDIYPDGGMARLRLLGELTLSARSDLGLRWFNLLPASTARLVLTAEAGLDGDDADELVASRPLHAVDGLPDPVRRLLIPGPCPVP